MKMWEVYAKNFFRPHVYRALHALFKHLKLRFCRWQCHFGFEKEGCLQKHYFLSQKLFTSSPFRGDRFQHEMVGVSLKLDVAGTPLRPGVQTPFNRIQSNVQTRVTWCSCGSSGCWGTGRPQSWTTWWFPRARSGAGCSRPEPSLTTRRNSRSEPNQGVTTSTGKCSVLQPAWSKDQTCRGHFWRRRWWWSQHAGTQPADQKFTEKPEKKSEQKRLSWLRKILMFWKEMKCQRFCRGGHRSAGLGWSHRACWTRSTRSSHCKILMGSKMMTMRRTTMTTTIMVMSITRRTLQPDTGQHSHPRWETRAQCQQNPLEPVKSENQPRHENNSTIWSKRPFERISEPDKRQALQQEA